MLPVLLGSSRLSLVGLDRYAWDQLAEAEEVADDYGLGARDSLQDAVEAVIAILGMKVRVGAGNACAEGHMLIECSQT